MIAKFISNWPVTFRAFLYFIIAFIIAVNEKLVDILMKDEWPSAQRVTAAVLIGLGVGLTAVRAFYDGSAQRHEDKQSGQTSFFNQQQKGQ